MTIMFMVSAVNAYRVWTRLKTVVMVNAIFVHRSARSVEEFIIRQRHEILPVKIILNFLVFLVTGVAVVMFSSLVGIFLKKKMRIHQGKNLKSNNRIRIAKDQRSTLASLKFGSSVYRSSAKMKGEKKKHLVKPRGQWRERCHHCSNYDLSTKAGPARSLNSRWNSPRGHHCSNYELKWTDGQDLTDIGREFQSSGAANEKDRPLYVSFEPETQHIKPNKTIFFFFYYLALVPIAGSATYQLIRTVSRGQGSHL
ncbi:hypothetical protein GQR58_016374 [Nymphon striatum]|nr:hypothetical protein GQR58_016374 [Nymphon striatum]